MRSIPLEQVHIIEQLSKEGSVNQVWYFFKSNILMAEIIIFLKIVTGKLMKK